MNKALFGAGAMVLTYLVFLLPLSRPGKNLLLGIICAAIALTVYQVALRRNVSSAKHAAPVAGTMVLMLPFLIINKVMNLDVMTFYIWGAYIFIFALVNIIWVKVYE